MFQLANQTKLKGVQKAPSHIRSKLLLPTFSTGWGRPSRRTRRPAPGAAAGAVANEVRVQLSVWPAAAKSPKSGSDPAYEVTRALNAEPQHSGTALTSAALPRASGTHG
jgi:hypothetical protein